MSCVCINNNNNIVHVFIPFVYSLEKKNNNKNVHVNVNPPNRNVYVRPCMQYRNVFVTLRHGTRATCVAILLPKLSKLSPDASLLDNRSDLSVRFGCVTMKRSAEQIYV